jgi:alpha-D-ribose 1-methylphosphonate 5-triphosphate synthase subunit PhnH
MNADALAGGFSDAPIDAARAFRAIMQAMARPGTITRTETAQGPAPLSAAASAVLLALCDADTPLHLAPSHDTPAIRAWIAFHTGAPLTGGKHAHFALGTWDALQPLDRFPLGTAEYPDRSATLIVEQDALAPKGATLRGPGIKYTTYLSLPDIAPFRANHAHFPRGLDFIFTAGTQIAALPRSTEVR